MLNEDQRLEQILTIVDALADRVSDTGASVQVGMRGYINWQFLTPDGGIGGIGIFLRWRCASARFD